MRTIPRPRSHVADVITACTRNWADLTRGPLLVGMLTELTYSEQRYEDAGSRQVLHELLKYKDRPEDGTQADLLRYAYTSRLVKSADGRAVYEQLKANAWYGRCTACGYGEVSTLDHHLPKTSFPIFAVTPLNLVPVCAVCNQIKGSTLSEDPGQHPLHPYFDDLGQDRWLYASVVVRDNGPAALFRVQAPAAWDETLANRVHRQFDALGLARRYGTWAISSLVKESGRLSELLDMCGPEIGPGEVRAQLCDTAETEHRFDPNSWKTALYYGLAESDWYVTGGMRIP